MACGSTFQDICTEFSRINQDVEPEAVVELVNISQCNQWCKFEVFCIRYIKNFCNITIVEKQHVETEFALFFITKKRGVMVTLQSVISIILLVILVEGIQTFANIHVDLSNNG